MIISNRRRGNWRMVDMRAFSLLFILGAIVAVASAIDRPREQRRYEDYLSEHPTSAEGHNRYALYLSEEGDLLGAIAHWRTAQYLAPNDAAVANSLGGAFLQMGWSAKSAAQFTRAIELDRANAAYHFNLANVEFLFRHDLTAAWQMEVAEVLQRSLREFRQASRLSPNDIQYARAYAETFYVVPHPDWAEAAAAWQHVLTLAPGSNFVYLHLARISLKRGDANGVRQFLGKINDVHYDEVKRILLAKADQLPSHSALPSAKVR